MARKPLGVYARPTPDWYQHSRFNASAYAQIQTNVGCAVGLFNSDEQGRICHIIGASISLGYDQPGNSQPWVAGTYYSTPGSPIASPDSGFTFATKPFFDLDGIPSVQSQVFYPTGSEDVIERSLPLPITVPFSGISPFTGLAQTGVVFYPAGGIAAFRPGRGFYYWGFFTDESAGDCVYGVTFDFIMLAD